MPSTRPCSRRFAARELSITIEAYIYWAGEIGQRFAEALAAKGREGVKVKILLDAVGSSTIGTDILKTLESGHCQLAWYNPLRWYSLGRYNHRTHRKSLIIDGRIAFTGGAGIADHWKGNAEDPGHWRDMQIRLEGPAVTPLQTGFAQNWLQTTGELISGPLYYPPHSTPAGPLAVQTIMSSPEIGASTVRTMYYLSIICARKSIYIANPYFVPDEAAIDALVDARNRGVDVRIMVSGIRNDNWLARQNSVRLFGPHPRGRNRHPRIQPDDAPSQDDGRRRGVGHDRDDELRQSLVRVQRREQRLLLRRGHCVRDARDVPRGCGDVRAPDARRLAATRRASSWRGNRRRVPAGADLRAPDRDPGPEARGL